MIGQADLLLRAVPEAVRLGVQTGEYAVMGGVVRSATTGRIVAHLQETGGLMRLLEMLPGGAPLDLAAQAVSIVQNEQIKAGIAALHSLQVADLVLGGATLGVSIAGTAILSRQIAAVERKIDAIWPAIAGIANQLEDIRADTLERDFTRLHALADRVEMFWLPSATAVEWVDLAGDAHELTAQLLRQARQISGAGEPLAAEPLVDGYALGIELQVTARLAAGQDDMARHLAVDGVRHLVELGRPVRLGNLALAAMRDSDAGGSGRWEHDLEGAVGGLRPRIAQARRRELAAASRVATLAELDRQDIKGRDWLEIAREEKESPVMLLCTVDGAAPGGEGR